MIQAMRALGDRVPVIQANYTLPIPLGKTVTRNRERPHLPSKIGTVSLPIHVISRNLDRVP